MSRWISVIAHGMLGWAICGATVGLGRQVMPMPATLIVHAAVAPLAFALLTWHHFRRQPASSPGSTAFAMLAIVVALDAFLVAPFIERSFAMFRSILGTWIPFASIWLASYLVGRVARRRSDLGRLSRERAQVR